MSRPLLVVPFSPHTPLPHSALSGSSFSVSRTLSLSFSFALSPTPIGVEWGGVPSALLRVGVVLACAGLDGKVHRDVGLRQRRVRPRRSLVYRGGFGRLCRVVKKNVDERRPGHRHLTGGGCVFYFLNLNDKQSYTTREEEGARARRREQRSERAPHGKVDVYPV